MVVEFVPPSWAKLVIVSGDAAYGSKANMKMVKDRDKADRDRRWGFVFAIARTWKTVDEKMIKNLVTHLPRKLYTRTWIAKEIEGSGRKTFLPVQVICTFRNALVRWVFQFPGNSYMSLKDRVHAQL